MYLRKTYIIPIGARTVLVMLYQHGISFGIQNLLDYSFVLQMLYCDSISKEQVIVPENNPLGQLFVAFYVRLGQKPLMSHKENSQKSLRKP